MTKLIVTFRNLGKRLTVIYLKDAKHLVFIAETVFTVRKELDCYELFNTRVVPVRLIKLNLLSIPSGLGHSAILR